MKKKKKSLYNKKHDNHFSENTNFNLFFVQIQMRMDRVISGL